MIHTLHPKIKGLILDMDGVLWRGSQEIGNLSETFTRINELNLDYIFATNNSTRSHYQYTEKLKQYGLEIKPEKIVNSTLATSFLLKKEFSSGTKIYLIGEKGAKDTLENEGFIISEDDPKAVVVGLDRQLTYEKLKKAVLFINNGSKFFGTNPDNSFPIPEGEAPGAGAIIASISTTTGIEPIIAGKPFPYMMNMALKRMNLSSEEVLVVGDRYETDIMGGKNAKCKTALVLSGISTIDDINKWEHKPDLILPELKYLFEKT